MHFGGSVCHLFQSRKHMRLLCPNKGETCGNAKKKLQDTKERIAKVQREERANENGSFFKQKEKRLEEAQKNIDAAYKTLEEKEDDINNMLTNSTLKEKVAHFSC
ncbi:hypothetical protein HRI_000288700 [Hibiscus trionum]|uniref:Uncharacterized protein n=1 Tax=Hibiscus trionum TaxID=183268 RepID=A0A9W7GVY3_HIBTR|nr:hypothetical protein HRI_000288700 [Hibiscus trionum]